VHACDSLRCRAGSNVRRVHRMGRRRRVAASGMLCGLAGVVLVLSTTAFQSTTGSRVSDLIVAAAMLGGVGQAHGAMIAGGDRGSDHLDHGGLQ